jgi:serine/threonine protein kinase
MIHRDLKPANVLVNEPNGRCVCKLCDFGVSSIGGSGKGPRTLTSGKGTPVYMAPEVMNGWRGRAHYDEKVGYHSLTVITVL